MGDAGTMSVAAINNLTTSGVQAVTGAKTFNDQKLVFRNPADTFSLTMRNPAITANKDSWFNTSYSYYIFKDGTTYYAKNGSTTAIDASGSDPGALLNTLQSSLIDGDVIQFENDTYTGTTDYTNNGKTRLQFIGNGATLSGWKIKFDGSTSLTSSRCIIHGFKFSGANAGIVIDNTSMTTVENCEFLNCSAGISFESSAKWSEIGRLSNCLFRRCTKGIVFKTPTGAGTGSYINSMIDHCFFSSSTPADGVITTDYTFIEIQSGVQVSEGKWTNSRFWFDAGSVIGIGINSTGTGTRCMIHKHYFENFSPATGTIGIQFNSGATSLYFLGRPIFAGNGTWDTKFKNTTNVQLHGSVETFRQGHTITPSATADTYGTVVNCVNIADVGGLPNLYIIIGGTVGASETVTVSIDTIGYQSLLTTVTKTYTATGTYPLAFTDYTAFVGAGNYTIIDNFAVKAKSSGASTTATVNFVAFNGGTATAKEITTPIQTSYEDWTKISAPASPTLEIGREYFKQVDTNNNGLFVKSKINGAVVEVQL